MSLKVFCLHKILQIQMQIMIQTTLLDFSVNVPYLAPGLLIPQFCNFLQLHDLKYLNYTYLLGSYVRTVKLKARYLIL